MGRACVRCEEEGNSLRCRSFQPNPWRPEKCSFCFHLMELHVGASDSVSRMNDSPTPAMHSTAIPIVDPIVPASAVLVTTSPSPPQSNFKPPTPYQLPALQLPSVGSPRQITPSLSSKNVRLTTSFTLDQLDSIPSPEKTPRATSTESTGNKSPTPSNKAPLSPSTEGSESARRRGNTTGEQKTARIYSPLLQKAKTLDRLQHDLFLEGRRLRQIEDSKAVLASLSTENAESSEKKAEKVASNNEEGEKKDRKSKDRSSKERELIVNKRENPFLPSSPEVPQRERRSTTWSKAVQKAKGLGKRNTSVNLKTFMSNPHATPPHNAEGLPLASKSSPDFSLSPNSPLALPMTSASTNTVASIESTYPIDQCDAIEDLTVVVSPPPTVRRKLTFGKSSSQPSVPRDCENEISEAILATRSLKLGKKSDQHVIRTNSDFSPFKTDSETDKATGAPDELVAALKRKIEELLQERDDYKAKYLEQLKINKELTANMNGGLRKRETLGAFAFLSESKSQQQPVSAELSPPGFGSTRSRKSAKIKAIPNEILSDFFSPTSPENPVVQRALNTPPVRRRRGSVFLEVSPLEEEIRNGEAEDVEAMLKKRANVENEILTTERNYLASLNILVETLLNPLRIASNGDKQIIDKKDIKTIFFQLEVIRGYNSALFEQLEERITPSNQSEFVLLGDIFLQMADYLRTYILYTSNYSTALQTLNNCMKSNPEFVKFLQSEKVMKQMGKSDLPDFLILPIQRLPRYVMLLKELIKCTPSYHLDRRPLQLALTKLTKVLDENQSTQEDIDNIQKVMTIQNLLGLKLVEADRRFVREGHLLVYHPKKESVKSISVFLFNNLILEAKHEEDKDSKESKWKLIKNIKLDTSCRLEPDLYKINDPSVFALLQVLPSESIKNNSFMLMVNLEKIIYVTPTPELKALWIRDISTFLEHLKKTEETRRTTIQNLTTKTPRKD